MGPIEIGFVSLVIIILLIYSGVYIPVALGMVSFVGVWIIKEDYDIALKLLAIAVSDSVAEYTFATVPMFTMMGLVVSKIGIGTDIYAVANQAFRRIRGGLGIATVAANAIFASVTGSSIASASVFTRVSVPEMVKFDYTRRFAVGVVAGSSVLGMLIPPSVMLIIYSFVAEQSVGQMFIAGIIPGLLLTLAYAVGIVLMATFALGFVGKGGLSANQNVNGESQKLMSFTELFARLIPVMFLIVVVLGGIYGGIVTPTEAGAAGALIALVIGLLRRRFGWKELKSTLVDTGHITASILFLIITASMYSRMLGVAALPTLFGDWLAGIELSFTAIMALYVILLIFLGTILDTASIILIVVPLFLPAIENFGGDLVWFGIVTVIGAEIGLLTPPLGISCFVIKSTINDPNITLFDVFAGAFPFAVVMLLVLIAVIAFPALSLILL